MLTLSEKILHCEKKSREQKYFVAPRTLIKEIEQEEMIYKLDNDDTITVLDKIFRIERG